MKPIMLFFSFLFFTTTQAQDAHPFYIGHSLVNFDMPAMVHGLAINSGKTTHYAQQITNGSPLRYNFTNYAGAQGTHYPDAFPNGNFNTLIATEAVPLQGHITYNKAYEYADTIFRYAKNNNNNIPVRYFYYETWHCNNSGIPQPGLPTGCAYDNSANSNTLWHPRLVADFPLWTGIVNYVRSQFPNDEIWMVPAGQAFYNLTTQINAGNVAGISNVNQLFVDDIHLTNKGNYFVACVMYACIYKQSPVGLTANLNNPYNIPYTDMPSPAQALAMQQAAWNTVTALASWTGVASVLPVKLIAFDGLCGSNGVALKWATASEIGNNYFGIEKSIDGVSWKNIGTITGQGSSSTVKKYLFTDINQNAPILFYRLKQFDISGKFNYSNVIKVINCVKNMPDILISPNPVKEVITIKVNGLSIKQQIQIYNSLGILVKEIKITPNTPINISNLVSGLYYIKIENYKQPFKFIKE
jgi:hypothetical protein